MGVACRFEKKKEKEIARWNCSSLCDITLVYQLLCVRSFAEKYNLIKAHYVKNKQVPRQARLQINSLEYVQTFVKTEVKTKQNKNAVASVPVPVPVILIL